MFYGKRSFLEWKSSLEHIASTVLIHRINVLVEEGFMEKKAAPTNASKFLYYLTDKGIDLVPVLIDLMEFGSNYHPGGGPELWLKKMARSRKKTILELKEKLVAERQQAFNEV